MFDMSVYVWYLDQASISSLGAIFLENLSLHGTYGMGLGYSL